jgi:hypothetical protein
VATSAYNSTKVELKSKHKGGKKGQSGNAQVHHEQNMPWVALRSGINKDKR